MAERDKRCDNCPHLIYPYNGRFDASHHKLPKKYWYRTCRLSYPPYDIDPFRGNYGDPDPDKCNNGTTKYDVRYKY